MALLFKGLGDNFPDWERELTALMPDLEIRVWPDVGDVADIDFAFVWNLPHGELKRFPNLKGIMNIGAGADALLRDPDLPRGVPLARIVDSKLTAQMTTYVVFAVIRHHRRIDHFEKLQGEARWQYERGLDNARCHVGIFGLGNLGTDAARNLAALGFTVAGWSRRPKAVDGVECFAGPEELMAFLNRTQILVCLLPLTSATEGIINAKTLAALPRGACLVNISRGGLVVEEDLLAALDRGHLAGATLDVFRTEPLPPDHPFWRHLGVLVTPHVAGNTTPSSAAPQVVENVRRARAGRSLIGQIDPLAGY